VTIEKEGEEGVKNEAVGIHNFGKKKRRGTKKKEKNVRGQSPQDRPGDSWGDTREGIKERKEHIGEHLVGEIDPAQGRMVASPMGRRGVTHTTEGERSGQNAESQEDAERLQLKPGRVN